MVATVSNHNFFFYYYFCYKLFLHPFLPGVSGTVKMLLFVCFAVISPWFFKCLLLCVNRIMNVFQKKKKMPVVHWIIAFLVWILISQGSFFAYHKFEQYFFCLCLGFFFFFAIVTWFSMWGKVSKIWHLLSNRCWIFLFMLEWITFAIWTVSEHIRKIY